MKAAARRAADWDCLAVDGGQTILPRNTSRKDCGAVAATKAIKWIGDFVPNWEWGPSPHLKASKSLCPKNIGGRKTRCGRNISLAIRLLMEVVPRHQNISLLSTPATVSLPVLSNSAKKRS